MSPQRTGKGRSKTSRTAARHAKAASANAMARSAPPDAMDTDMAAHWRAVTAGRLADAKIKQLRARSAELDALERDGQLIRAELVGEWVRRLLARHRSALDAADSLIDLRGHDPQTAESIRAVVREVVGRLRHNIAHAPEMGSPPPSIGDEGDGSIRSEAERRWA